MYKCALNTAAQSFLTSGVFFRVPGVSDDSKKTFKNVN